MFKKSGVNLVVSDIGVVRCSLTKRVEHKRSLVNARHNLIDLSSTVARHIFEQAFQMKVGMI